MKRQTSSLLTSQLVLDFPMVKQAMKITMRKWWDCHQPYYLQSIPSDSAFLKIFVNATVSAPTSITCFCLCVCLLSLSFEFIYLFDIVRFWYYFRLLKICTIFCMSSTTAMLVLLVAHFIFLESHMVGIMPQRQPIVLAKFVLKIIKISIPWYLETLWLSLTYFLLVKCPFYRIGM